MAIRKEQVLALLTLGVGALVARGHLQEQVFQNRFTPNWLKYEAKPTAAAPLVTSAAPAMVRRDFATEPSETRPLPPRPLVFPPRPPLSLASPQLDLGPDLRHAYMLRVDGATLAAATPAAVGDAAAAPAAPAAAEPAAEEGPVQSREQLLERAALTYDRVWYGKLAAPLFGTLEPDPKLDLFALEERGDFSGVTLRLRRYDVTKGKYGEVLVLGDDEVLDKIALAGTLRNEIVRRERKVPDGPAGLLERRDLIAWLLERARESSWVYDKAWEHAQRYRQDARADMEGLRLMLRVLRARGDIPGELAMLEGLPGEGPEGAFRFEGLGILKARLGLWNDAEADLRQAAALQPADPRPHAALAEFLRRLGRTDEALRSAARAQQTLSSLQDPNDLGRVVRVIVACHLAGGDVAAARAALAHVPKDQPQPYLEGCVHYAAGDAAAALQSFRSVSAGADVAAASLGQGVCLAVQGELQQAQEMLTRVHDREPLQRHRAAAALAWTYLRAGQYEQALAWVDRAVDANPQDAFPYYLRGRALRLAGLLPNAVDALAAALRLRDDFVHAVAEMAAVQAELALQAGGEEQVTAAIAARRYGDRAVELARPAPSTELLELQGLYAFAAADTEDARTAFTRARDLADEQHKWFGKGSLAVVDYSRGAVEDAVGVLERMVQDINSKDDPMAKWAAARLVEIGDHSEKEWLADSFDRSELGAMWLPDLDAALKPELLDGRLVFRGTLTKGASAERDGAVKRAKSFLAVAVTMTLGPGHAQSGTAGLGVEMHRGGSGGVDFLAHFGIKDGKPGIRIVDGKEQGTDNVVVKPLDIPGLNPVGPHQLELRVVPRGDELSKQLMLLASWNGVVVYRHELKTLSASSTAGLKTKLLVTGSKNDAVDVAFDDYRLERRKEQ